MAIKEIERLFMKSVDISVIIPFCQNWLHAAFGYLQGRDGEVVAHPEYQVVFGAENFVFRQISCTDTDFRDDRKGKETERSRCRTDRRRPWE